MKTTHVPWLVLVPFTFIIPASGCAGQESTKPFLPSTAVPDRLQPDHAEPAYTDCDRVMHGTYTNLEEEVIQHFDESGNVALTTRENLSCDASTEACGNYEASGTYDSRGNPLSGETTIDGQSGGVWTWSWTYDDDARTEVGTSGEAKRTNRYDEDWRLVQEQYTDGTAGNLRTEDHSWEGEDNIESTTLEASTSWGESTTVVSKFYVDHLLSSTLSAVDGREPNRMEIDRDNAGNRHTVQVFSAEDEVRFTGSYSGDCF